MGEQMHATAMLEAITAAKTNASCNALAREVWQAWGEQKLSDQQAQTLAELLEAKKGPIRQTDTVAFRAPDIAAAALARGAQSHFPPKRRQPRSQNRAESIQRRRTLAASGPMPPHLAANFTQAELSTLRIVADEVRDHNGCALFLAEIAARAGVCVTSARRAIKIAANLGLVTIQERRQDKRPNKSNIVRVISREWALWIERQKARKSKPQKQMRLREHQRTEAVGDRRIGCKNLESTDKGSYRTIKGDRDKRGQRPSLASSAVAYATPRRQ